MGIFFSKQVLVDKLLNRTQIGVKVGIDAANGDIAHGLLKT